MIRERPYQNLNPTYIRGAGVVWPSSALDKGHNIGNHGGALYEVRSLRPIYSGRPMRYKSNRQTHKVG
uniref:Uncharacterized protein n=1 Tax=Amphimedon queenslandica TaxID=400682 RepID=A0A1X7TRM9_AMPQE